MACQGKTESTAQAKHDNNFIHTYTRAAIEFIFLHSHNHKRVTVQNAQRGEPICLKHKKVTFAGTVHLTFE